MKRARSSFSTKGSKWEATTRPGERSRSCAPMSSSTRRSSTEFLSLAKPKPQSRSPRASPNADLIVKASGVRVEIGGARAYYAPSTDHVQMPPDEAFASPPDRAATILHELCIVATVIVGGVGFCAGEAHGLSARP